MEVDEHMQADGINLKEGEQVKFFDYDKNINNVEYYEILEDLMERWEHEIVEFKEAKVAMIQIKLDVTSRQLAMKRILGINSMAGLCLA